MVFELISIKLLCIICSSLAILILSLGCFLSIVPVQGGPCPAEDEADAEGDAAEDEGDAGGDAAEEEGEKKGDEEGGDGDGEGDDGKEGEEEEGDEDVKKEKDGELLANP